MRCDDLAFGLARACCKSSGLIAHVIPAESTAAAVAAKMDSGNWVMFIPSNTARYSGTSIGAAPLAAFSR